tara:strand:+ start:538 stop:723 length:186 start_codon:yes stop_codon:yes gene_type:complete
MGRPKCVDIDSVYRRLSQAEEALKDVMFEINSILNTIPKPIRMCDTPEDPIYIGEQDVREN